MSLTKLDWIVIAGYLAGTLLLGLYFRNRSSKSLDDYFVSGRNTKWWLAGTSMVATTFAADTPLLVTGLVYRQGIAGNWIWWALLLSGMMTVFLFARLWRRSGLLTDVQFAEMRYGGKPAAFLRGFRAIYLGLFMNCLILGWVTKAMVTIVATSTGVSDAKALAICVFFLIPFTGIYVALGGLWGVLWTDLFQFIFMMAVVIGVAYYAVAAVGGIQPLLAKVAMATPPAGTTVVGDPTRFLPDFKDFSADGWWMLPALTFVVNIGIQWWASWYPGAEPGGGGYIAQRIFSAKNEKEGMLSVLWFNVAHYAVRPWPWVLTGLAAIVLYPNLAQPEQGYMLVLNNQMPSAFRGLAVAGFLAAFMSTVATQLNWGASYLVSDFYRRFIKRQATEQHYVNISRVMTVILVLASGAVAAELTSILSGWQFVLETGAGTGTVYLLRWYWWRINAWSEISAMIAALVTSVTLNVWAPFTGTSSLVFAKTTITTTLVTTVVWVLVTILTPAERPEVLESFYRKVRPWAGGWQPVTKMAPEVPQTWDLGRNLTAWVLGCVMVYAVLFGTGKLILKHWELGTGLWVIAVLSAYFLMKQIGRITAEPEIASTAGGD